MTIKPPEGREPEPESGGDSPPNDADGLPTIDSRKKASGAPMPEAGGQGRGATEAPRPETAGQRKQPHGSVTCQLRETKGFGGGVVLDHSDLPADVFDDPPPSARYSVVGEIARGGMGAIIKIVDNDIRRAVAMKVVLEGQDREALERFVEEAQVTGQLEHPNIVPVHELAMDRSGKVFFTMKMVKGESLEKVLRRIAENDRESVDRHPLSSLLEIFLKVCDAVAFAHSRGVLHRDLKPDNIMVGNFGEALVMDWGLSKVQGRADKHGGRIVESIRSGSESGRTLDGEVMGTPSYMPPEQANGDVDMIDERSDVFALGGILYKILTLEAPYTGSNVDAILRKAVLGKIIRPSKRAPGRRIPKELEAICVKAMSEKSSQRYQSIEAMTEDLRAFQENRLVKACVYSPFERFVRFLRRHPAGSMASAVAMVVIAAGTAVIGIVAGETRVARALEAESKAKAAVAELDRKKAVKEKTHAVSERNEAVSLLEKGRRVSAVLRSADVELGGTLKNLKKSYYAIRSPDQKKAAGDALWPKIQEFCRTVPDDPASKAAMLAVKGLLRKLAGYEEEGFDILAESRSTDKDVAYGALFEAMIWLARYLGSQPLPKLLLLYTGVEFGEVPPETPEMAEARNRFQNLLSEVKKAGVWGDSASADFEQVMAGFSGFQSGDWESAERGLSKALAIPELIWLREEILLARAKVRYLAKNFDSGISDVEKLLETTPDNFEAFFFLGAMWDGAALSNKWKGKDPRGAFESAIEAYRKMLDLRPDGTLISLNLANSYLLLGEAEDELGVDATASIEASYSWADKLVSVPGYESTGRQCRGNAAGMLGKFYGEEDPRSEKSFRQAYEDFKACARMNPDDAEILCAKADHATELGNLELLSGRDPTSLIQEALDDTGKAIRLSPGIMNGFRRKARALQLKAAYVERKGGDPFALLDQSAAVISEGLEFHKDDLALLFERANVYLRKALSEQNRAGDPQKTYADSIRDFEKALIVNPRMASGWLGCGKAYLNLGVFITNTGADATPQFSKAEECFGRALEIRPSDWEATAHLGLVEHNTGDYAKAIELLGKALRVAGRNVSWINDAMRQAKGALENPDTVIPEWGKELDKAGAAFQGGNLKLARELMESALEKAKTAGDYQNPKFNFTMIAIHYNLSGACCLAAIGKVDSDKESRNLTGEERTAWKKKALEHLAKAIDFGFDNRDRVLKDEMFAPLFDMPEFKKLMKDWEEKLK